MTRLEKPLSDIAANSMMSGEFSSYTLTRAMSVEEPALEATGVLHPFTLLLFVFLLVFYLFQVFLCPCFSPNGSCGYSA